jgi:biotin carboxyl carrier protein
MYFVKLQDGDEIAVQIAETRRGQWRATTADGETVDLEVRGRGSDGTFVILVDGTERTFRIDPSAAGGFTLVEDGRRHDFDVFHAADLVLERVASNTPEVAETETLTSPITGIVLEVVAEVGDSVDEGDVVVVVEAMKMENSLGAPRSGTVKELFARAGQTVFVGDPLVRIQ